MSRFMLPVLAALALCLTASAQTVPAPAASYWPLEVGNIWEYDFGYYPPYQGGEYSVHTRYHVQSEVEGQPGHFVVERRKQRVNRDWPPFEPVFDTTVWRFDEATGYRTVDGTQVGLWLAALDGDTTPCGSSECEVTEAVGAVSLPSSTITTALKTFHFSVFHPSGGYFTTTSEFASGIGPTQFTERSGNTVDHTLSLEGLRYARVGESEYGTPRWPVAASPAPDTDPLAVRVGPNPTAGAVTVHVDLPTHGDVRVEVYDALGRRVAPIVDGSRSAGPHAWVWESADAAPGVYVVRVTVGGATASRRVSVVR